MKPIDIIKQAILLEDGKKITLTFEDRKKFLSMKASLYDAKKSVTEEIKITTKNERSISIEKAPKTTNDFELTIEDSDDFQFYETIEEIENETKTKLKPEQIEVNKLEQEKKKFLEDFSAFVISNKEEVSIPGTPSYSEKNHRQGILSKLEKNIRDKKALYGIEPTRTPATEEELLAQEKEFEEMTEKELQELQELEERMQKRKATKAFIDNY